MWMNQSKESMELCPWPALYADDAQIYITLSKSRPEMSLLQDCLLDLGDRMRSSKLKINPDKTDFYCLEQKTTKIIMQHFTAKFLDHEITST